MEIKLLKPHKHDGKEYVAGDTLVVDDEIAEWLIKNKVATVSVDTAIEGNTAASYGAYKSDKSKGGKK